MFCNLRIVDISMTAHMYVQYESLKPPRYSWRGNSRHDMPQTPDDCSSWTINRRHRDLDLLYRHCRIMPSDLVGTIVIVESLSRVCRALYAPAKTSAFILSMSTMSICCKYTIFSRSWSFGRAPPSSSAHRPLRWCARSILKVNEAIGAYVLYIGTYTHAVRTVDDWRVPVAKLLSGYTADVGGRTDHLAGEAFPPKLSYHGSFSSMSVQGVPRQGITWTTLLDPSWHATF